MKNKIFFLGMIILILSLGLVFVGCKDDSDDGGGLPITWWTWVSSQEDGAYTATADIEIVTNKNNTECDVTVTGVPQSTYRIYATQFGILYSPIAGKTYKVSWKWKAINKSFTNVCIRYAQPTNFIDNPAYFFGNYNNTMTIPTSEEYKEYTFTMPDNCRENFTFMVGGDTGSFKIYDFKIELIENPN